MVFTEWNKDESKWENRTKITFAVDVNGNPLVTIVYMWDSNSTAWMGFSKTEATYSVSAEVFTNYTWDILTSQWKTASRTTYSYSDHSTGFSDISAGKTISMYPNPATNYIIFNLEGIAGPAGVQLIDINGSKVLDRIVPDDGRVEVGHLSRGLYVFRVNGSGTSVTGRVILK